MNSKIDNTADIIDVRDLIARYEELFDAREDDGLSIDEMHEMQSVESILDDIKGYGGDEQWRGKWYPITLVRDSYFKSYAQELADDIGAIPANTQWPLTCIDWDQAASELKHDYTSTEINGVTYWFR